MKLHRRTAFSSALTLIEVIGVLAVVAILAADITPAVFERMDMAARDAEATSLNAASEALIQDSLQARRFPTVANLPSAIAAYLNEPASAVTVNKRRLNRVFLADPNLNINGSGLPYTQSVSGAANRPANARLMIVSSIARALPTINASSFDNIWSAPRNTVPSSLSSWSGKGENLVIERIELGPLFHKVILMNLDPPPYVGQYTVDSSGMASVAPGAVVTAYYLKGTALKLYRPDGSGNSLNLTEMIVEDVSFVYQNDRWARGIGPRGVPNGDLASLVDLFLQEPVPCDPGTGATQKSVINSFYVYLWAYSDWAYGDPTAVPPIPSFAGAGASQPIQYPGYSTLVTAQSHLDGQDHSFLRNLIE